MDLSAGMVAKTPVHPAGKVTAFDHETGLPIVERRKTAEPSKPAPKTEEKKPETKAAELETKQDKSETKPEEKPSEPDVFDHVTSTDGEKQEVTQKLAKGMAVTLPDGTKATISYLSPQMRIARVRTEDGRNLTVRQNQLTISKEKTNVRNSKRDAAVAEGRNERDGAAQGKEKEGGRPGKRADEKPAQGAND